MADEKETKQEVTTIQQPDKEAEEAPQAVERAEQKTETIPARFSAENIKPGATVRVSQKIVEGSKERIQIFEGMVLAKRGSRGVNQTITVRKVSNGYGVERIFPLASPTITNIEVVKQMRVRRAKLNYLRNPRAKKLKEVK